MNAFFSFFSFHEFGTLIVTIGAVMICGSSALVGTFIYLRKQALVGDAISHALLPGVCVGFMLAGEKNIFALLIGAACSGWLSIYGIHFISQKTKIKNDAAIGLVLSFFFGLGIMLLTHIQHSGNEHQAGLNHILFGQAAALVKQDVIIFSTLSALILCTVLLLYKELKLLCFDPEFAKAIGLPVKTLQFLLNTLIVMAIVAGVQAVGLVLMAALLITPAAAASFWTHNFKKLLMLSVLFSIISGVIGAFISYTYPSMPTGPWIVMAVSFIAGLSFFLAPKKGIIATYIVKRNYLKKNTEENVLKCLFTLGIQRKGNFFERTTLDDLKGQRYFPNHLLKNTLNRLLKKGYIERESNNNVKLNQYGLKIGKRIMKIHILWEAYLSDYLTIAPDHVHEDAESIEHLLTPKLISELEATLNYPELSYLKEVEKDHYKSNYKSD